LVDLCLTVSSYLSLGCAELVQMLTADWCYGVRSVSDATVPRFLHCTRCVHALDVVIWLEEGAD
jgi:hypothetical protein